jgi:hypothetical protein
MVCWTSASTSRFAKCTSHFHGAILPCHASFVSYSWGRLAPLGPFWLSSERGQEQEVAPWPTHHLWDHCFSGYYPRDSRDG